MTEEQRRMDRLYNEARKAKLAAEKEARDNNPEDILGEGFYRARQDKKGGGGKGGGTGGGSGGFRPYVKPAAPSRRKMG